MDELFVALVRRGAAYGRAQLDRALAAPQPLWALWRLSTDSYVAALSTEYLALANHRKAIAHEVATAAEQFRLAQLDAFRRTLDRNGAGPGVLPVGTLLLALEGLARVIVIERSVGATALHREAIDLVEGELTRLEGPPADRHR
jgi:hypothetical protein